MNYNYYAAPASIQRCLARPNSFDLPVPPLRSGKDSRRRWSLRRRQQVADPVAENAHLVRLQIRDVKA